MLLAKQRLPRIVKYNVLNKMVINNKLELSKIKDVYKYFQKDNVLKQVTQLLNIKGMEYDELMKNHTSLMNKIWVDGQEIDISKGINKIFFRF